MRSLIATYHGAEREIGRFATIGEIERARARAEADEADHRQECLTSGDAYAPTAFRIGPV